MPPGVSASATTSTHSHGASMSSTTRSTSLSADPGSASARSATVSDQPGCSPPNSCSTLRVAISAKSARRSYDDTRPDGPTARSR